MLAVAPTLNSVTRYDPTRTLGIRNAFARELSRRFDALARLVRKAIVTEDVFGMRREVHRVVTHAEDDMTTPGHEAFGFPRSADKVAAFMAWLEHQVNLGILEVYEGTQIGRAIEWAWTNKYIQSAYQMGILRARQEMINSGRQVPSIEQSGGMATAFSAPFHVDRVGLIYTRAFQDLRGVTAIMAQQISRVLAQGIAEGRNPNELARQLVSTISGPVGDLGLTDTLGRFIPAKRRAQLIARTEVIRAHHVATIQEYRNWGVEGVFVKAEWVTAEDGRVCEECNALQHKVFDLDTIESMIPYHPQCRCVAIPLDVTDEISNSRR